MLLDEEEKEQQQRQESEVRYGEQQDRLVPNKSRAKRARASTHITMPFPIPPS